MYVDYQGFSKSAEEDETIGDLPYAHWEISGGLALLALLTCNGNLRH